MRHYLINSVTVGTTRLWAGTVVDDALQPTGPIREVGGVLLDAALYDLAGAAELARNHVLRGNPEAADAVMQAAVERQPADVEAQATWYVDPVGGSDLGSGLTPAAALRTLGEFFRRMQGKVAAVSPVVELLGDCAAEGLVACRGTFPLMVEIHGQQTVRHTGTVTGHVAYSHALPGPPVYGKITDAGLTGQWGSEAGVNLIDRCVILTSGANADSWAWLLRDDGSKTAVVGTWFNPHTRLEVTPANGDAYKVVDFTRLGPVLQGTTAKVCVEDCELVGAGKPSWEGYGDAEFVRCKFSGAGDGATTPLFGSGLPFFEACLFLDGVQVGTSAYGTLFGSVLKNYPCTVSGNSTMLFDGPHTIGIRTGTGSSMEVVVALAGYAVFLAGSGYGVITNGPANVVQLRPVAAAMVAGTVWSLGGSSGQGIWCASGAQLAWTNPATADASTKFYFAGADHDAVVGEVSKSVAQLGTAGFFNALNGAAVVPTKQFPSG